ncbi:Extensin-like protein precursor [Myxococcus hansupus]|uniref:Extensin-like protein n=1 Tax=Pseudomyxococcus hansupus TaxID=1297742 RepID=A0A0H4XGI5_9BACT|nr:GYF domain-containing protein [Myxococcus hansupus]AKQ67362.1 Extensin-like protein precursor [Myxococcus hansupus]
MAGNSGEDNANPDHRREAAPEPPDAGSSPVLDGVSDAELDAIVGQLRTDKNLRVRASAQPRYREAPQSERLHRGAGRTRASTLGEEPPREAAPPPAKQAWYIVIGGAAYGPHDLTELKGHLDRGAVGPDSLCWREGFGEWLPLGHIPELASALLPSSVPAGAPPVPAAAMGSGLPQVARTVDLAEATTERVILEPHAPVSTTPAAVPPATLAPRMDAPEPVTVPGGGAPQGAGQPVAGFSGGEAARSDSPGFAAPRTPGPVTAAPHAEPLDGAVALAARGAPPMEVAPQPVGTHAVLTDASASRDARARRKRRLGVVLAVGAVGGMSVALALGVFDGGKREGQGADAVDATPRASATPAVAEPASAEAEAVAQASPDVAAPTPSAGGAGGGTRMESDGPVASTGSLAPSVAETARRAPPEAPVGAGSSAPGLSAVSVDRGDRVPELTGTERTTRAATGGTRTSPEERVFERPTGSLSSRDVAVAFVIGKNSVAPAPEPASSARPATTVAEAAVAPRSEDDLGPDEDFDRMLSGPGPNATKREKRTVWVPPDPTAPRETLDLATVFAVVHARRSELAACGREQSAPPGEGDRAVLRLSVLPSGKVESITTETPWLRGTSLVRCMQQKIGAWTFPRHRTQGAPVVFRYEF